MCRLSLVAERLFRKQQVLGPIPRVGSMNYPSRLSRRYERLNKQQSYLLLAGSAVLLILFIMFGFPAILNLSSTISSLRRGVTKVALDKGIAPAVPRLAQDFDATNSANIKLFGIADPKVTVELWQNDSSVNTTVVDQDGKFSFNVALTKGDNLFSVQATSEQGIKSERSEIYKIAYLSSSPKLEIAAPKDGDTVKDPQIIISGKTDIDVTVTANDRLLIAKNDGSFAGALFLSNGDNKIKIVATDRAGNQTTKEITVKYSP